MEYHVGHGRRTNLITTLWKKCSKQCSPETISFMGLVNIHHGQILGFENVRLVSVPSDIHPHLYSKRKTNGETDREVPHVNLKLKFTINVALILLFH